MLRAEPSAEPGEPAIQDGCRQVHYSADDHSGYLLVKMLLPLPTCRGANTTAYPHPDSVGYADMGTARTSVGLGALSSTNVDGFHTSGLWEGNIEAHIVRHVIPQTWTTLVGFEETRCYRRHLRNTRITSSAYPSGYRVRSTSSSRKHAYSPADLAKPRLQVPHQYC
jgi:hypothetical protein